MHNFCGCGLFFNFYRKAEDHARSQKSAVLLLVVASTCKPTSKSGGVVSKKKYEATSKCSETPHCSETPAPTLAVRDSPTIFTCCYWRLPRGSCSTPLEPSVQRGYWAVSNTYQHASRNITTVFSVQNVYRSFVPTGSTTGRHMELSSTVLTGRQNFLKYSPVAVYDVDQE